MSAAPVPPKADVQPRKRLWDTVLTATPILLTVLGTILASRSSGEMTQAQYHRSIAAQNQSKAGNQWAFFQAKRVRGTIQQMFAERGAFRPAGALALANRLPKALERTNAEAVLLLQAVTAAQKDTTADKVELVALKQAVEKYQSEIQKAVKGARESQPAVAKLLSSGEANNDDGLIYLTSATLPVPADETVSEPQDAVAAVLDSEILEVLNLIRKEKEKADAEVNQKLKKMDAMKIEQAIDAGEAKAAKFEKSTDPTTKSIREVDKGLQNQEALFRPVQAAAEDVEAAASDLPTDDPKLGEVRKTAGALQASVGRLTADVSLVSNRFKAARCDYDVRRYEREARFNQEIAGLYELQVRKSSLTSDQHRERSVYFLYGMLAAQAGVTIATFGLAVRQKSILWALATAAGVTAITISFFAYQFI